MQLRLQWQKVFEMINDPKRMKELSRGITSGYFHVGFTLLAVKIQCSKKLLICVTTNILFPYRMIVAADHD